MLGVWNLDGRPVERAELARLSASLRHRGPDGEGLWAEGPVGLACQLFRVTPEAAREVQPAIDPSGPVLVFDGRLDNREELFAAIAGVSAGAADPTLVLAAYAAFGDRFPERLNGDFALGLFDPRRQRLLLVRDAVGVRPLYYARLGRTFLFASEIKGILAHPQMIARPNDALLDDFLFRRLHLRPDDGATCFEGILSVPPGHTAVLTRERFQLSRYWDFDLSPQARLGDFEDHVAAFRDLFAQAVRRRLRSAHPVSVSVSGGLDSSSIFCFARMLADQDPGLAPPIGTSYVGKAGTPSDESAYLREIERHCGATIERFPNLPTGMMDGARDEVWHVEAPLLDAQWSGTRAYLQGTRQLGARVILTGHWGDQFLCDQAYLLDLVGRFDWRRVGAHLREYGRWFTDTPPSQFRRRFAAALIRHYLPTALLPLLRRIRDGVSSTPRPGRVYSRAFRHHPGGAGTQWNHGSASAHSRSQYRAARSKFHTLCMEWNNKVAAAAGLEIAFPFLDRDLLSFLLATPGDRQSPHGIPKAILREAGRGIVPAAILGRRWKADFSALVNQGVINDYREVARVLKPDCLSVDRGYVARPALQRELSRAKEALRGPTCEVSWALRDLLGLELWLQRFFGHREAEGSVISHARQEA